MRFCPPNVTFSVSWKNGVSECFMETVSSLALSSFLLLFGTIQMVIYWRHATLNTAFSRNSSTKLYKFQVFLLMLFPALAVGRFILWSFVYDKNEILGYMVSCFVTWLEKLLNLDISASNHFVDCLLLSIHIRVDVQRASLPVASPAQPRPWTSATGLLDNVVRGGESFLYQPEERRMVVWLIDVSSN